MHNFQAVLGERVRRKRKERGLTQKQLADNINSNKRTILDIENGRGNPKLETLVAVLNYLEIDPYTIFFPEPPMRSEAMTLLMQLLRDCNEDQIQSIVTIVKAVMEFSEAKDKINAI